MRAHGTSLWLSLLMVVGLAATPAPLLAANPAPASATGTAPSGAAPRTAVLEALDACRTRLDRELDVGYARIAARCPQLPKELAADTAARWLPQGWQDAGNDLSAGSLEELRTLIAREQDLRPQTRAARVARLHDVLAGLGEVTHTRSGLWARFTAWLRQVLSSEDDPSEPGFLTRMLNRINVREGTVELIAYVALAAVIVLTGRIVWQEMRAAGIQPRGLAALLPAAARRPGARPRQSRAQLEGATLLERPRLLLELVLDELSRRERLPPPSALTTRELVRAAAFTDARDGERLRSLALAAEDVRFAQAPVGEARLHTALADGMALLERIAALPADAGRPG